VSCAGAMTDLLARLGSVIDEEARSVTAFEYQDLAETISQKRMIFLELSRYAHVSVGAHGDDEVAMVLDALRASLEKNSRILFNHLTAARETQAVLSRVFDELQSDGRYTAFHQSSSMKP
jgi:hypothetical protein